ncbi:MAG: hypothetical protein HQL90_04160 [Magnetococcales bacterium]|nr:hypothetical protein [Magnetococcales bacterium]
MCVIELATEQGAACVDRVLFVAVNIGGWAMSSELEELKKKLKDTEEKLAFAITLLTEWAAAVEHDAEWGGWVEHFKDVFYYDSPERRHLLTEMLKARFESGVYGVCYGCEESTTVRTLPSYTGFFCKECVPVMEDNQCQK